MISSHIVRTSITLLVVSFLIWAWPAMGPDQALESLDYSSDYSVSASDQTGGNVPAFGFAPAHGFTRENTTASLKIIDNGLEASIVGGLFGETSAAGSVTDGSLAFALRSATGKALAANSEVGLLSPDSGGTVKDLLDNLNYKVAEEDLVFPALDQPVPRFGTIIIKRAPGIVIRHDGKKEQLKTRSATVKELLAEKRIKLGDDDRVEPGLSDKIVPNLEVRIFRVKFKEEEIKEEIAFETKVQDDPTAYTGTRSVKVAGVNGRRVKKYKVTLEDGQEVKRELVKEEVTKEPVMQVVLRGTKSRPVYTAPSGGGDYWDLINAAAGKYNVDAGVMKLIMQCESGGNPNAYNRNGYYGLFQFDSGTFAQWNIFPGAGIWDPKAQIYAAANLLAHGGRNRWGC